MAKIYETVFKIAGEVSKTFDASFIKASQQAAKLDNDIRQLEKSRGNVTRFKELKSELAQTESAFDSAQAEVRRLAHEIESTEKPTKTLLGQFDRAKSKAGKLKNELSEQRAELQRLRAGMSEAGISTRNLVQDQAKLERQAEAAARAQKRLREAQGSIRATNRAIQANAAYREQMRGQVVDAVALAAAMGAPVKLAAEWEQSLAEFNKVAGQTPGELKGISREAQRLAVETGVAREQIIDAYTAAAQAGYARDEWAAFAETSAKMGVAFDTTGEKAGEMLKSWRSGMGLTMQEATELAGAANHLANNMNATAMGVANILQRQGAVFKTAGLDASTSAGLAAALESTAPSPEIAATAGKNFVLALTRGAALESSKQDALQNLGFDPQELAAQMQEAPREAIMEVLKTIRSLDAEEQTGVISKIFGVDSIGGIAPLIGNLDNLSRAFDLVSDSSLYSNSLQEEFNALQQTTNQRAKKAQEGIKMLATSFGSALLPAVNDVLQEVGPLAMKMAEFAEENPALIKTIVTVTGALVGLKIATIAGGYAFALIKGPILGVWKAVQLVRLAYVAATTATTVNTLAQNRSVATMVALKSAQIAATIATKAVTAAQWLWNAALTANPIGLIITAVGALVAAGYYLITNWNSVVQFFTGMWNTIKDLFSSGWEMISSIFSWSPLEMVMKTWGAAFDWISSKIQWLKDAAGAVAEFFGFGDDEESNNNANTASKSEEIAKTDREAINRAKMDRLRARGDRMRAQAEEQGSRDLVAGSRVTNNRSNSNKKMEFNYSPTVQVSGTNDPATTDRNVRTALAEDRRNFERQFDEMMRNEERMSYGY